MGDRMLGQSEGHARNVELYMREGIFHILDPVSSRILRTSSYGDLLSTIYDPTVSPPPSYANSITGESAGRYSAAAIFIQPETLTVDSMQTIYLADRLADSSAATIDPSTGESWDWIVRRFGQSAAELSFFGREGPLGSAFPRILDLICMEDDSLIVICGSSKSTTLYRYSREGRLMSSLVLDTMALPAPASLLDGLDIQENEGALHADLEKVLARSSAQGFEIVLKLNYYHEIFNQDRSLSTGIEPAGSWIFVVDGRTGDGKSWLQLSTAGDEGEDWELAGLAGQDFILLAPVEESQGEQTLELSGSPVDYSQTRIRRIDVQAKVKGSADILLPKTAGLLSSLKLSSTGQLYGILLGEERASVLWWDLPF